jgi:dipeptidyl aminopeptidase/acylaminoacyl peptidase
MNNTGKRIAPYGTWVSPISAESVAALGIGQRSILREVHVDGSDVYWIHPQPDQNGRYQLLRSRAGGTPQASLPPEFDARSRVHEYGGGSYTVREGVLVFSHSQDGRLYRVLPGEDPAAITPAPPTGEDWRYADGRLTPGGSGYISVQERHSAQGEVHNVLVHIPLEPLSPPQELIAGADFYANPRLSPNGKKLAWLAWDHPQMPWDGTTLCVADLRVDGTLVNPVRITGGENVSIFQPEWSPEGVLHFVSDQSGSWRLYRLESDGIQALGGPPGEVGLPQWVFGYSRYAFLAGDRIVCALRTAGQDRLILLQPGSEVVEDLASDLSEIPYLASDGLNRIYLVGANYRTAPSLFMIDTQTDRRELLDSPTLEGIDDRYFSAPVPLAYASKGKTAAHALLYPPKNPDFEPPIGEKPPLIVLTHGGPTSAARTNLQLEIQYWTSRGYLVADVNYRGSTGYGREYRQRLAGRWGHADVEDVEYLTRHLTEAGQIDPQRCIIRGGSAGGWTTLCALVFSDAFHAGSSAYAVADAESLAQETHKFEARYLDYLIGSYPEEVEQYRARSPLHHAGQISVPVILFQGSEDPVVPVSQTEAMVAALEHQEVPHAYLLFEGEGHGFRDPEVIQRMLEAEQWFFARVFGFTPADILEPVPTRHFPEP